MKKQSNLLQAIRNTLRTWVSLMLTLCIGLGIFLINGSVLRSIDGVRTFYLYSPSSQAATSSALNVRDVFYLSGESVFIACPSRSHAEKQAREVLDTFCVQVIFTENVGDTMSVYGFSSRIIGGIILCGQVVNFHVAVSNAGCSVGTPVIFGGY